MQERQHNRIGARISLALAAVVGILALVSSVPAGAGVPGAYAQGEGKTAINSDLFVDKGEVVKGDASVTDGDLTVDGEVKGKVVIVHGNGYINGKVDGDVSIVDGTLELAAGSEVLGNVLRVGDSKVEKDPAATVRGQISALDMPVPGSDLLASQPAGPLPANRINGGLTGPFRNVAGLVMWLGISFAILLFVLGFAFIVPQRVVVSTSTLDAAPAPAIVVGLITAVLLGPVFALLSTLLALTVVGVVLVPVLAIGVGLALLFGLSNICLWLGRRVHESVRHGQQTTPTLNSHQQALVEVALGAVVLLAVTLFPTLVLSGWVDGLLWGLVYFAACIGLGAGIMSRFGTLAPPVKRPQPAP